jgi:acetyl esterase/lipase
MRGPGIVVAQLLLLWCALLFVPFRWRPLGRFLLLPTVFAVAYVPFIAMAGTVLVIAGVASGSWWIVLPAAVATVGATAVVVNVGRTRVDLTGVLGPDRDGGLPPRRDRRMVHRWWTGQVAQGPRPRLRRDVAFSTVPDTDRVLLCDVWQPPDEVVPSGVALVYLHGSAYMILDKDFATRPLFRQLTGQGHVIVDVAYRMYPDTDVPGMVADALRAVGWVREHADELGVDADRIVLAGGSAGGHLSLLAAYGHHEQAFVPPELTGADLRVRAVVSLYGQVGLDSLYRHTGQDVACDPGDPEPDWDAPPPRMLLRLFGDDAARLKLQFMTVAGCSIPLTGGTPDTAPERYAEASALTYVDTDCPPTLLLHGTHDEMAPVAAARLLQARLEQLDAPVAAVYLPHTDHMFDLVGTRWSPSARVAIHTLERFLAEIAAGDPFPDR